MWQKVKSVSSFKLDPWLGLFELVRKKENLYTKWHLGREVLAFRNTSGIINSWVSGMTADVWVGNNTNRKLTSKMDTEGTMFWVLRCSLQKLKLTLAFLPLVKQGHKVGCGMVNLMLEHYPLDYCGHGHHWDSWALGNSWPDSEGREETSLISSRVSKVLPMAKMWSFVDRVLLWRRLGYLCFLFHLEYLTFLVPWTSLAVWMKPMGHFSE